MISATFLWGNVFFGGTLQIHAKNSNFWDHPLFEISEYAFKQIKKLLWWACDIQGEFQQTWNYTKIIKIHYLPITTQSTICPFL